MALLGDALSCLFGFGNGFVDITARTTLLNYLFFLPVAILACTPVVPWLAGKLHNAAARRGGVGTISVGVMNAIAAIAPVLLLGLSALALVGDSYNPFLYFRF